MKQYIGALLLLFAVLLSTPGYAQERGQDKKVIMPSREVTIKNVLGEIEKQTDYKVAVNWENIDPQKTAMLPASQMSVKEVLDNILEGFGKWDIVGEQIVIVYDENAGKQENYTVYSTMHRNQLPSQMRVVPDPWSKKQISPEEIAHIRNGYWHANENGADSIGLAILNFRVNSSVLEKGYMNNARTLDMIHRTFSDKDLLTAMDFITITAAASPEGNTTANEKLADDRAKAIKSYIMWKYPFMNRERVFTFSIGEDWTGLRKMVEGDMYVPCRQEVLDVLDSHYDNNAKRSALRRIGDGQAYRYIADNMLPKLRGAAACMIYFKEDPQPIIITETQVDTVYVDRIVEVPVEVKVPVEVEPVKKSNPYYLAIKTNMLYDVALLPNLALEFSLPNRWSIEVEGMWSWWNTKTTHNNCWRIQSGGLEVRKWLGNRSKTPFTGHYIGVYGMYGTYDVRFNGKTGYLSDNSYSAGISYGYAMPIGRSLNLEFGIGIGYLGGEYDTYQYSEITDSFPWISTKNRNYFGPTKAKVSLVWLIGSGKNESKRK